MTRKGTTTELPLSGLKVIDFTGVQAGPACTQMLAWFGADVIKVERTNGGDVTRGRLRDIPELDALYFTMLNSNKRSLAIDTKTPEGSEVMEKLIREADVLVENFAPGAMDRMGLSWDKLRESWQLVAEAHGSGRWLSKPGRSSSWCLRGLAAPRGLP